MKKELLKMFATDTKDTKKRKLYQRHYNVPRHEDKSTIRIIISKRMYDDIVISIENISRDMVDVVQTMALKKED